MIDPNAWDWWVDANDRRQWLILVKYQEGGLGLSPEQAAELEILQGVAELIVNAVSPRASVGDVPSERSK